MGKETPEDVLAGLTPNVGLAYSDVERQIEEDPTLIPTSASELLVEPAVLDPCEVQAPSGRAGRSII